MTVFYRGPRALNHESDVVPHCVFAIRELSHVPVVEALPSRVTPVTVGFSGLAGSVAVAMSTGRSDLPAMAVGMQITAAVVTRGTCRRVRPGRQPLLAVYRGQIDSTGAREFGQVRRGLMGAMENVTDR